jgi:hypothetical protein
MWCRLVGMSWRMISRGFEWTESIARAVELLL